MNLFPQKQSVKTHKTSQTILQANEQSHSRKRHISGFHEKAYMEQLRTTYMTVMQWFMYFCMGTVESWPKPLNDYVRKGVGQPWEHRWRW